MSYEILYTSAPSGLKPGSSGYCTVQGSRGIPAPAVDLLESLSGYRHVFTPGSPEAKQNPVNWGHYLIRVAGRVEHVLSRVGDCELDYTGRSNKLAHHLVVDAPTTATLPGGPAWFLSRPGLMYDQWDGTVSHLGTPRIPPPERRTGGKCAAWGAATGDAGWGGVLAESFLADPERKVFVVYAPGTNVLALFEEAIALLPEHRRWDVTFATYGAALPKTVDCLWSGLIAGSPEVAQSHRFVNALRIDLADRVGRAIGGPLVELARTGVSSASTRPTIRHQSSPSPPRLAAEPIYEGGYQPVPPPPGILPGPRPSHLDEPEPPSLPPRSGRGGRSKHKWLKLFGAGLLVLALMATAAAYFLRDMLRPPIEPRDLASTQPERPASPKLQTETTPTPEPLTLDKGAHGATTPDPPVEPRGSESTTASSAGMPPGSGGAGPASSQGNPAPRVPQLRRLVGELTMRRGAPIPLKLPENWDKDLGRKVSINMLAPVGGAARELFNKQVHQKFDAQSIELVAIIPKIYSQPIASFAVVADEKGRRIEATEKSKLDPHQETVTAFSALLLTDLENHDRVLVNFKASPTVSAFSNSFGNALTTVAPEGLDRFIAEIGTQSLSVIDLQASLNGANVNLSKDNNGNFTADISGLTKNWIRSVSIKPSLDSETTTVEKEKKPSTVTTLKLRFVVDPPFSEIKEELDSRRNKLMELWRELRSLLDSKNLTDARFSDVLFNINAATDTPKFRSQCDELRSLAKNLPDGDMNDKARKESKERAINAVDEYLRELVQFREFSVASSGINQHLKVTSGRFQYKVYPVQRHPEQPSDGQPNTSLQDFTFDLFTVNEPR